MTPKILRVIVGVGLGDPGFTTDEDAIAGAVPNEPRVKLKAPAITSNFRM